MLERVAGLGELALLDDELPGHQRTQRPSSRSSPTTWLSTPFPIADDPTAVAALIS
jgi:hypothetical protein